MLWNGLHPLKTWSVKSKTQIHPDIAEPVYWCVELWADASWCCNCPGYRHRKKNPIYCYHIKNKIVELIEKYNSVQEAIKFFRKQKK